MTAQHPVYSLDRGDFVAAGELSAGERLATLAGPTAVLGIQPQHTAGQHKPQTVYNLEVQGQHVFRVTSNGLLVHNSYADDIANGAVEMHHSIPRGIQRRLREAGNLAADSRDVIGKPGLPNRIPVERGLHRHIHSGKGYVGKGKDGVGGGHYNNAFHRLIKGQGNYRNITPEQLVEIRDFLVRWFGL